MLPALSSQGRDARYCTKEAVIGKMRPSKLKATPSLSHFLRAPEGGNVKSGSRSQQKRERTGGRRAAMPVCASA